MDTKEKSSLHTNHRQRMREKVKNYGLENLHEHEILEFLLYPFIPRKDTNVIAHELLNKFGSIEKVFDANPEMLMSVRNMTKNASLYLTSFPQVVRLYNLQKLGEKPMLDTLNNAVEYFRALFNGSHQESMYVAVVNARGQLVDKYEVGNRDTQQCSIDIKKFVLRTVTNHTNNIFVAHNHPSGDPKPSMADYDFTHWLVSLCEIMGLKLIDHLIITNDDYYSFNKNGELSQYKSVYKDYVKFATVMDRFRM